MRVLGIVTAGIIASGLQCTAAWAVPVTEPPPHHSPHRVTHQASIEPAGSEHAGLPTGPDQSVPPADLAHHVITHHAARMHARHKFAFAREAPDLTLPELAPNLLSPQERDVSEIADQNGDRQFLMVDKSLGRILLFEDGRPVYMGRALTGQSTADRLPPNELSEKFDKLNALDTKVTPAGRFTIARGYDPDYGPLFDIKEIKGKDWGIAIHQVYLGIPSEHRDIRLQSPRNDDKNITFGCINVTPGTLQLLLRELPKEGATVLYVLPRDASTTTTYFAMHNS